MLLIILVVCALDLRPLNLVAMTLDCARILNGKPVKVSFIVAKSLYTLVGPTMAGAADRDIVPAWFEVRVTTDSFG